MHNKLNKLKGFTMVEIMIVVAIVGLLGAIAIPNLVHARTRSQTDTCISNLRTIEHATQQWALEYNRAANAPVTYNDIKDFFRREVACPADPGRSFATSYALTVVTNRASCQIAPLTHALGE